MGFPELLATCKAAAKAIWLALPCTKFSKVKSGRSPDLICADGLKGLSTFSEAGATGKYVICQLGGNWCKWCIWFAKFIKDDSEINQLVKDNFVYIHVNFKSRNDETSQKVSKRLGNAGRFGFPVLVILDADGKVIHIQNSAYLEKGEGYDRKKVLDFFKHWTPSAVRGE